MLLAHPLKCYFRDLIVEVVIRLFFVFFLLFLLQCLQFSLLVELLILEIYNYLGRLHVFLRVYLVDFSEEFPLVKALLSVIYHIHGQLHLFRQHPTVVSLEEMVEKLVNCLKKSVLVDETGKEDTQP